MSGSGPASAACKAVTWNALRAGVLTSAPCASSTSTAWRWPKNAARPSGWNPSAAQALTCVGSSARSCWSRSTTAHRGGFVDRQAVGARLGEQTLGFVALAAIQRLHERRHGGGLGIRHGARCYHWRADDLRRLPGARGAAASGDRGRQARGQRSMRMPLEQVAVRRIVTEDERDRNRAVGRAEHRRAAVSAGPPDRPAHQRWPATRRHRTRRSG